MKDAVDWLFQCWLTEVKRNVTRWLFEDERRVNTVGDAYDDDD